MAMDGLPEGVPPSGRVPRQLLQEASILKRRWRRYRGEIGKSRSIIGFSTPRGVNIGEGGHRGDPLGSQEGTWCGPGWGRARDPSRVPVVAPLRYLGDFLYNFSVIFGALLMAEKP